MQVVFSKNLQKFSVSASCTQNQSETKKKGNSWSTWLFSKVHLIWPEKEPYLKLITLYLSYRFRAHLGQYLAVYTMEKFKRHTLNIFFAMNLIYFWLYEIYKFLVSQTKIFLHLCIKYLQCQKPKVHCN